MEDSGTDGGSRFAGYRYVEHRRVLLHADGSEVALRPKTLETFCHLARYADRVVDRETLHRAVWGDTVVTDDSLGKCVGEIRRALGDTAHEVLRTVPRQGYMLVADASPEPLGSPAPSAACVPAAEGAGSTESLEPLSPVGPAMPSSAAPTRSPLWRLAVLAAPLLTVLALMLGRDDETSRPATIALTAPARGEATVPGDGTASPVAPADAGTAAVNASDADEPDAIEPRRSPSPRERVPTLALRLSEPPSSAAEERLAALASAVRVALSRYRTVVVAPPAEAADFVLTLSLRTDGDAVPLDLSLHDGAGRTLFAETYELEAGEAAARALGVRVAAMIASPGSGLVGRYLLAGSLYKPLESLTRAECYAHGYDCTNCSGELDDITPRAEACLADILARDPGDARAWGLQSTIHAHQYQWGTGLPEPLYSDPQARAHLPDLAVRAANRAEQLADGTDSAVYWGMAQAYSASCDVPKLRAAIERGLEINPDDPSLLAAFGNWLAYAGEWDEGVALIERALAIEPRFYRRWWLFGPAKRHYARGEYEQALAGFRRAFNERNWISHLQLAYTLPHLGRMEEARRARAELEQLAPGITIEAALQFYKLYCFPDDFVGRMREALEAVGLPSRGDHSDLDAIEVAHARLVEVGDVELEVIDVGAGMPIVFVHGAVSDYRSWGHYLAPVSAKYRYLSYSRRYHGSQPWPDDGRNMTVPVAAADLVGLIETLGLGPVHLVSWSSGARVAALAALERPDLVRGVVHYEPIIGGVLDADDPDIPRQARDELFAGFDRLDRLVAAGHDELAAHALIETVFELPPGGFDAELTWVRRIMLDNSRTLPLTGTGSPWRSVLDCERLGATTVPTLIVRGERTNAFWRHLHARVADCTPTAELAELPGVNHAGPIRDPQALFALIDTFVERHR